MCRLLGAVTSAPAPLAATLGGELPAFTAMSRVHNDGWGMAWWDTDDNLQLRKEPISVADSDVFPALESQVQTDATILHLRKASAGMPLTMQNTHPFSTGATAFAHNGQFGPVAGIDEVLTARGVPIPEGGTDSVRYYALVQSLMRDLLPVEALREAARLIIDACPDWVGLNALLLTQSSLLAIACWNAERNVSAEVELGSYELVYRVGAGEVVVASDGWDPSNGHWDRLTNGMVLEVDRGDLRTRVHTATR